MQVQSRLIEHGMAPSIILMDPRVAAINRQIAQLVQPTPNLAKLLKQPNVTLTPKPGCEERLAELLKQRYELIQDQCW